MKGEAGWREDVKISISVGGATQEILAWIRANPNSVNVTARALVCVMPNVETCTNYHVKEDAILVLAWSAMTTV